MDLPQMPNDRRISDGMNSPVMDDHSIAAHLV